MVLSYTLAKRASSGRGGRLPLLPDRQFVIVDLPIRSFEIESPVDKLHACKRAEVWCPEGTEEVDARRLRGWRGLSEVMARGRGRWYTDADNQGRSPCGALEYRIEASELREGRRVHSERGGGGRSLRLSAVGEHGRRDEVGGGKPLDRALVQGGRALGRVGQIPYDLWCDGEVADAVGRSGVRGERELEDGQLLQRQAASSAPTSCVAFFPGAGGVPNTFCADNNSSTHSAH